MLPEVGQSRPLLVGERANMSGVTTALLSCAFNRRIVQNTRSPAFARVPQTQALAIFRDCPPRNIIPLRAEPADQGIIG